MFLFFETYIYIYIHIYIYTHMVSVFSLSLSLMVHVDVLTMAPPYYVFVLVLCAVSLVDVLTFESESNLWHRSLPKNKAMHPCRCCGELLIPPPKESRKHVKRDLTSCPFGSPPPVLVELQGTCLLIRLVISPSFG